MPNILTAIADALGPLMPARWRSDIPVVPVVRLSGVIGAAVPLRPGLGLATTA
jgi:serine protease SohB